MAQDIMRSSARDNLKALRSDLMVVKAAYARVFRNDFSKATLREAVGAAFAVHEARLDTADALLTNP